MKYDATKAETTFSTLQAGITLAVLSQFQEYDNQIKVLVEEIKKLREENEELKSAGVPE